MGEAAFQSVPCRLRNLKPMPWVIRGILRCPPRDAENKRHPASQFSPPETKAGWRILERLGGAAQMRGIVRPHVPGLANVSQEIRARMPE
jgi:hypothetical protein